MSKDDILCACGQAAEFPEESPVLCSDCLDAQLDELNERELEEEI